MPLVNTAPIAPTVVLVLPLVAWRARVAMTVPVVESAWRKGRGMKGGWRGGKGDPSTSVFVYPCTSLY